MKELVLHPLTREQLENFISAPSHALMLIGPTGSGKHTLAVSLVESILQLPAGSFAGYPYKAVLSAEDGKAIGIETVRGLEQFLSLKVPRSGPYNQAVIIEDAEALTLEAQNALLKTLEEPPQASLIVLSASHEQSLLPTVRSRAQVITVKRPERAVLTTYFEARNFGTAAINQAYAISGGLPGLMHSLLAHTDHPLLEATERARQLLSQPLYERLLTVDELAKQRSLAVNMTFILQQMAHAGLQTASSKTSSKWRKVLSASYKANEALTASAQPKLVLTHLMLNL